MNFAQEVANAAKGIEVSAPSAEAKTTDVTPNKTESEIFNNNISFKPPEHGEIHPDQKVESAPKEMPVVHAKEGKIRIGTEVFDTAEEALRYATELQTTIIQRDAFEQGKLSAQPKELPPPEPDFFEEVESQIFENPKEAIKKIHQKAVEDAKKMMEERDVEKKKNEDIEKSRNETWNSFYTSNNDLSSPEAQKVVKYILENNWKELGPMQADKALPILADRARSFIRSLKETQLPTSELQSGKVTTTSSSNGATATVKEKTSSAIDFISQLNKHRKRDTK